MFAGSVIIKVLSPNRQQTVVFPLELKEPLQWLPQPGCHDDDLSAAVNRKDTAAIQHNRWPIYCKGEFPLYPYLADAVSLCKRRDVLGYGGTAQFGIAATTGMVQYLVIETRSSTGGRSDTEFTGQ